jgi:hypothetical protein
MCDCYGCQFIHDQYIYGISIDEDLNALQGHDNTIDDRTQRLGLNPQLIPPQEYFAENPEDWVCAESRRTIALEAIRRWQAYLTEVEQEIADGGPAWRQKAEL